MPVSREVNHPLPVGARVHHHAWQFSEADGCGHGWGTVLAVKPQHDGSVEYEVQRDEPLAPSLPNKPTWWGSHHIDRLLIGEAAAADEVTVRLTVEEARHMATWMRASASHLDDDEPGVHAAWETMPAGRATRKLEAALAATKADGAERHNSGPHVATSRAA